MVVVVKSEVTVRSGRPVWLEIGFQSGDEKDSDDDRKKF